MTGPPLPMLHGPLVLVELALCVLPDVGPSRTATSRIELWETGDTLGARDGMNEIAVSCPVHPERLLGDILPLSPP